MPELPEVEITARLLGAALEGAEVESAMAPGINVMKSFKPPLDGLAGDSVAGVRRRGKMLIVDFRSGLSLLIHLMSAGRLQLYEKRAGPRDRTSRILIRLDGGRELRLREFGTRQRAWARLMPADEVEADEAVAKLGPEAWPGPVPAEVVTTTDRPLYSLLRDQRTLTGIGRTWADEILWTAKLSPFKRAADLSPEEAERLIGAIHDRLDGAISFYGTELRLPLPDKLPKPLEVHGREGEPCTRCGEEILAVHYSDYVLCYCPAEQTGGQPLKDRRLSRLLK
ncbi:MAG: DNA-formamidopyrimidine glycosylase [Solirubrobacterales bacterium]|nr:DNA-formamidopyrimidine glycosylase [Solirubrobacterales bacterium]